MTLLGSLAPFRFHFLDVRDLFPTPTHLQRLSGSFILGVLTVHNDVPGVRILLSFLPGGLTPTVFHCPTQFKRAVA